MPPGEPQRPSEDPLGECTGPQIQLSVHAKGCGGAEAVVRRRHYTRILVGAREGLARVVIGKRECRLKQERSALWGG